MQKFKKGDLVKDHTKSIYVVLSDGRPSFLHGNSLEYNLLRVVSEDGYKINGKVATTKLHTQLELAREWFTRSAADLSRLDGALRGLENSEVREIIKNYERSKS